MTPASVSDYRELARRRLPRVLFDYIDGGSYAEATLAANVDDLNALTLRQRVLRDVSRLSMETQVFGQTLANPRFWREHAKRAAEMKGLFTRNMPVQMREAALKDMFNSLLRGIGLPEAKAVTTEATGGGAKFSHMAWAPTFDKVTLAPKTVGCLVEYSRRMLLNATPSVENVVRMDLTKKIAEATGGESIAANLALLENNARVGAEIAVALSRL